MQIFIGIIIVLTLLLIDLLPSKGDSKNDKDSKNNIDSKNNTDSENNIDSENNTDSEDNTEPIRTLHEILEYEYFNDDNNEYKYSDEITKNLNILY